MLKRIWITDMKHPAFQFYPGDWLKDTALRCCSPAARGVWMDLICMMYEAPRRGVLRVKNGEKFCKISLKTLANSISGCTVKMIEELIANGVVRVARKDGALYSKRLIRDELHRRHRADSGQKGGKANHKQTVSKPQANTEAKTGSSSSSSSSTSVIKEKREQTGIQQKPSLTEVNNFFLEEKFKAKGEVFFNWYQSRGWPQGDWRSLARVWESREKLPDDAAAADDRLCIVDHKPGHKFQVTAKGGKVWLCQECLVAVERVGVKAFGVMSPRQIEETVLRGKSVRAAV